MPALEDRYNRQQRTLQARLRASLTRLYGATVDPDDIDGSFAALFPRAAAIIRAGQSAGVSLSTAYLSALILRDGGRTARLPIRRDLVGTSQVGSLEEGMDAWPSMVKAEIGKGRPREEAIAFGAYLATRFGDNETRRAMDEQTDFVVRESKQFRGWVGILHPPTCDECVAHNTGFHGPDEAPFRHGSCDCSMQWVVI